MGLWGFPDHPRSRGVYISPPSPAPSRRGSSPLARGLHVRYNLSSKTRRIIPARAGFTVMRGSSGSPSGDHPRSRGVYSALLASIILPGGSSPLARGLRDATARYSSGPLDHPRSRGVYMTLVLGGGREKGSSPLARGLQDHRPRGAEGAGIIPARAGFTGAHSTMTSRP